ncbi:hypothetical protein CFII64_21170 [Pseudomonas sp. CFII64]|nr:hypothetical protein CFII64_21170 [Pseudomonas sp. CFII64]
MEAFLPFGYFPYFVLASLMLELISAAHGGFFLRITLLQCLFVK